MRIGDGSDNGDSDGGAGGWSAWTRSCTRIYSLVVSGLKPADWEIRFVICVLD